MKNFIKRLLRENLEEMSGFSRVRRMMLADVPNVNTIGIMTAENPMAKALPPQENNKRMEELKADIRKLGLGFIPIKGKYGNVEKSLLIPNISIEDIISLGNKYEQESIIHGTKDYKEDFAYFNFKYIEGNSTMQSRNISLSGTDIQSREDFFSAVKNRKFIIPFFDDEYENKAPSKNYGSNNIPKVNKVNTQSSDL